MIPLTLVCLALIALLAYQHHSQGKERERLYTARTLKDAPPLEPLVPVDVEGPDGYSEDAEVNAIVRGEEVLPT